MICRGTWKRHDWSTPDANGIVECKRCPRIKNNGPARAALAMMFPLHGMTQLLKEKNEAEQERT